MSDTQKCFAYLKENIPLWIKDLQAVEKTIEERHNEISRIPVPVQQAQKRTGSNTSIRLDNDAPAPQPPAVEVTSAPQLDAPAPPPLSLTQQINIAKRKRKTASLLTGNMSNRVKYRSRAMIEVYYDGEVQKSFETLVRNIGTGRNLLRKGKMAARMEAFAGGLDDDDNDGLPSLGKMELPKSLNTRSFGAARQRTAPNTLAAGTDTYDAVDKELEKAQSLCERGAHQFLRDGDCRIETQQATKRFEEVQQISEKELTRLQEKEAKKKPETSSTPTLDAALSKPSAPTITPVPPISSSIGKAQGTMEIEVDDDDDDDPDFAPPVFRRMARQRY